MRGWNVGQGQFVSSVTAKDWDLGGLSLCLNIDESTLDVADVTLDAEGVTQLRRKLQQVERYLAQQAAEAAEG